MQEYSKVCLHMRQCRCVGCDAKKIAAIIVSSRSKLSAVQRLMKLVLQLFLAQQLQLQATTRCNSFTTSLPVQHIKPHTHLAYFWAFPRKKGQ